MSIKETNRFECKDEDGNLYTVIEYTTYVTFKPLSGPPQEKEGKMMHKLSNGNSVNDIDGKKFQITKGNIVIWKV